MDAITSVDAHAVLASQLSLRPLRPIMATCYCRISATRALCMRFSRFYSRFNGFGVCGCQPGTHSTALAARVSRIIFQLMRTSTNGPQARVRAALPTMSVKSSPSMLERTSARARCFAPKHACELPNSFSRKPQLEKSLLRIAANHAQRTNTMPFSQLAFGRLRSRSRNGKRVAGRAAGIAQQVAQWDSCSRSRSGNRAAGRAMGSV